MLSKYTDAQLHEFRNHCYDLLPHGSLLERSNARLALDLLCRELDRRELNKTRLSLVPAHCPSPERRPINAWS
jgi:hypothetical protein